MQDNSKKSCSGHRCWHTFARGVACSVARGEARGEARGMALSGTARAAAAGHTSAEHDLQVQARGVCYVRLPPARRAARDRCGGQEPVHA